MIKNIGLISLGSGGTMGHMSLTTKLADALLKKSKKVFLFSEYNYKDFINIKNKRLKIIKIPKQKHMKTVGGKLDYKYKRYLIKSLKKNNIEAIIFSTFYDLEILNYAKKNNIKRILISYPLRDSHRRAIYTRNYFNYFDKIVTLKDIFDIKRMFPNEIFVSPFSSGKSIKNKRHSIKKILVTCGGGGRPSSKPFFNIISSIIKKLRKNKNIKFTIIKGNSQVKSRSLPNCKIIKWYKNFKGLLTKHDLVISEAGYFTLIDLISLEKPAILIPGERRIDNQELRAIEFERNKLGLAFFPMENISEWTSKLSFLIDNPSIINKFSKNFKKINKKIFKGKNIVGVILKELK